MKKRAFSMDGIGSLGRFELEVQLDIGRELNETDYSNLREFAGKLLEELNAETLRLKPETKVKYEETKKALLDCFGDRAIYAQEIPNEYCDCYQCKQTSPWFMVTTTKGTIKIGWRKRVINIDWSTMNREDAETLFPNEDVTKDDRLIHAWGYEKAKEYINKILA
jgi:hypothetical protein